MRAATTMTRDVVCVPPELPLTRAWALMQEMRVRHLPVVQHGKLVGMLSDRDVLLHAETDERDHVIVGQDLVGEAMRIEPLTCLRSTTVAALAKLMIDRKIDALPIVSEVDRKHVIGLVTSTDLLWLLVEDNDKVLPLDFTVHNASKEGLVATA
jgi:acetoin utilization protein AcuB